MGKIFDKLMNTMRLNGDDYDEEFDDNIDDDFDDSFDNDFDGEYDEPEEMPKKTFTAAAKPESMASKPKNIKTLKTTSSRKIVPINGTQNIQEVRVVRPANYDAAREIVDVLLDGQACIVNLEGISFDLAAQITDFIFGGCYALKGNIEKENNFIFVITPSGLEITGDIQNLVSKKTTPDTMASGYQAR